MKTEYNETFEQLLAEYNLPHDLAFSVYIPQEVRRILDDEILVTDLGISLRGFNKLYNAKESSESHSTIEDNENHFHVDWHVAPPDNKKAFMLGVRTLILLAEKFEQANMRGVRFTFSFQTPELGLAWVRHHNLQEDDDKHYISDRLSFHKRRGREELGALDKNEQPFWALLVIDI
jgi:hypothetical protein